MPIFIAGDNVFLFFEVEGNPPPDYKFHKGFKDLDVEPRYERWTDGGGDHNHVILGVKECRSASLVSNCHSFGPEGRCQIFRLYFVFQPIWII